MPRSSAPGRLATATRIALVSSDQFATVGTVIVTFLAKPLLEVILLVSIVAVSSGADLTIVAYAGLLISAISGVAGGIAGAVAGDRGRGVLFEVLGHARPTWVFWGSRFVVPAALSLVMTSAGLTTVFFVGSVPIGMYAMAMALLPACLVVGGLLGVFVGSLAAVMRDPFFAADMAVWALPILTGVVAPLTAYPEVAAAFCRFVPGSGIVEALRHSATGLATWSALALDFAVCAGLALAGSAIVRLATRALRSGRRTESF